MSPTFGNDGDNEKLGEWIEKVKSEGDIPFLGIDDDSPNGWATPPGENFMVRGPDYLSSRKKVPGGDYLLKPLGFDWLRGGSKIGRILGHEEGRVRKALLKAGKGRPFVWAFNLQLPFKNYSLVSYFVAAEPPPEGSLAGRFLKGGEDFKNARLKMIANVVKGPWIVKAAVGEQAVSILGRAAVCRYAAGENYIEVDVDVGVSMVGRAVVRLAFGYIQTLTVDLAFLLEGQEEAELPEQILGAVRFSELNPEAAGFLEKPREEEGRSSLPSRVWSSIGSGFSHLIHPGEDHGDGVAKK